MINTKPAWKKILLLIIINIAWIVIVIRIFNSNALKIDEINAKLRVFVASGSIKVRAVNKDGIPISFSARMRNPYISPFYVVIYGLAYSENYNGNYPRIGTHWNKDSSWVHWSIETPEKAEDYFRNCAEWIISHIRFVKGKAHIIYDFDFPYARYPGGKLSAPWWSGLCDGYAILLLLRANECFNDIKYLDAATVLYESVISDIETGGCLSSLNGRIWIEEYIDPKQEPDKMSYVLNGMIYATIGVLAYEEAAQIKPGIGPELYSSIVDNAGEYDQGCWSYYDRLGNSANIKYHSIHVSLLAEIVTKTKNEKIYELHRRWSIGEKHAAVCWLKSPGISIGKLHLFCEIVLSFIIFNTFIVLLDRYLSSKRNRARLKAAV